MSRYYEMSLDYFLKSFLKVSAMCSSAPVRFDFSKSLVRLYLDPDRSGNVKVDISFRN